MWTLKCLLFFFKVSLAFFPNVFISFYPLEDNSLHTLWWRLWCSTSRSNLWRGCSVLPGFKRSIPAYEWHSSHSNAPWHGIREVHKGQRHLLWIWPWHIHDSLSSVLNDILLMSLSLVTHWTQTLKKVSCTWLWPFSACLFFLLVLPSYITSYKKHLYLL